MAHDVFISYSTKDKTTADAVCAMLEGQGIRCWIAPRDILPGMDWGEAIIDAIEGSRAMILIFSGHANQSSQIKREVERAVNKNVTVVPFRIENVPMSKSLEYFVSTPHWLDAMSPPMEQHLRQLADTLQRLLARPVVRDGGNVAPAQPAPVPQRGPGVPPGMPPRPPPAPPQPYAPPRSRPVPAQPAMSPPQSWPGGSPATAYPTPRSGNGMAVASFVFGLLSGCILPFIGSILAIIFGFFGLKRSREPSAGGKALSLWGIILGILTTVFWIVLMSGGWLLMYVEDQEARPYAQQFIQSLSGNDIKAATDHASGLSEQQVQDLYEKHFRAWGPLQGVEWKSAVWDDRTPSKADNCAVKGEAILKNGRHKVFLLMKKEGNGWRVTDLKVDD